VHGLFKELAKIAQEAAKWAMANPAAVNQMMVVGYHGHKEIKRYYKSLSKSDRQRVDSAIRYITNQAIKFTIGSVVSDLSALILQAGGDSSVIDFALKVVEKGVEIGVDKAIEEARKTPEGEAFLIDSLPIVLSDEEMTSRLAAANAATQRLAAEKSLILKQEEFERVKLREEARLAEEIRIQEELLLQDRLICEQVERERLRIIKHEQEKPMRLLRNSGRSGAVALLCIATIITLSRMTGITGFCCSGPLLITMIFLITITSMHCYNSWES